MKISSLFFLTTNQYKFSEFERLFAGFDVKLEQLDYDISEIQTLDVEEIVRDKAAKAYAKIYQPVMVDHSSIAMKALNDIPQGLNHIYWEKLKDQVCEIAVRLENNKAEIISCIGICDGKKIYTISGKINGVIANCPSKTGIFHLDRVFIPDGFDVVLSEMPAPERDKNGYRLQAVMKTIDLFKTIDLGKKLGIK
jgi:XTP/dITP diphosphohydrolase